MEFKFEILRDDCFFHFRKFNLYDDLYRCQFNLASIYQRACNYEQALKFITQACATAKKMKSKLNETEAMYQKAVVRGLFIVKLKDVIFWFLSADYINKLKNKNKQEKMHNISFVIRQSWYICKFFIFCRRMQATYITFIAKKFKHFLSIHFPLLFVT